jgi:hypothetical protein
MAQPSRTLVLTLTAVTDKFKKGLGDAEKQLGGFGGKLGDFAKKAGLAFAAVGAAAGALAIKIGKDSVAAASDLAEEVSKAGVVFGDSADEINAWAESAASAFGQSQRQATAAASNFALFGKSAGLTGDDLMDFSTSFTELASDLASFNNTSPEDAIEALGAALRGESEPIRRYQVLLDDATLRQRALELGIIETTKNALTPQQRVLAAQAEIFAQTTVAQGDYARTSDGLANSQRNLAANLENVKATLGEALLPVAEDFTAFLIEAIPQVQDFARDMGEKLGPAISTAGLFIKNDLLPFAAEVWPHIRDFAIWVKDLVAGFVEFVREEIAPRALQLIRDLSEPATAAWTEIKNLAGAVRDATSAFKAANPEGSILLDWLFKLETIKWDFILGRIEQFATVLRGVAEAIERLSRLGAPGGFGGAGGSFDLPEGFVPGQVIPGSQMGYVPPRGGRQQPSAPVIVNINGPVDSEGAAREVRKVLADSSRRTGYGQLATAV